MVRYNNIMVNIERNFFADSFYHVFNRGVEKRKVYTDETDYTQFIRRLAYYQQVNTPRRFSEDEFKLKDRQAPFQYELIAYCLMPNHYHLLLQANSEAGISVAIGNTLNSYTRYFNTRHHRVGPLFQGKFKSVLVESDIQLLHTHRYIHLNPYVAGLEDVVGVRPWSSFKEYFGSDRVTICNQDTFYNHSLLNREGLMEFTTDFADYARSAKILQKIAIGDDE